MAEFDWQRFLKTWSEEMLDVLENGDYTNELPPQASASRWLGFLGATEEDIKEAEKRLGMTLPPSYREFLKVTNGWQQPEAFSASTAGSLWPTSGLQWFSVRHQEWIDAYVNAGPWRPVSDADYFTYGDQQDCALHLRVEYLQTALEISDTGDGAIYLLNPKVINGDGEWEAWLFANWMPGAERYVSFHELMQSQYRAWQREMPMLKGEMSEDEYDFYSDSTRLKNL